MEIFPAAFRFTLIWEQKRKETAPRLVGALGKSGLLLVEAEQWRIQGQQHTRGRACPRQDPFPAQPHPGTSGCCMCWGQDAAGMPVIP